MTRWLHFALAVGLLYAVAQAQEVDLQNNVLARAEPSAEALSTSPEAVPGRNATFLANLRALRGGAWRELKVSGAPSRRHEACYVRAADGRHYLIGGRRAQPVSIFDASTSTWSSAAGPGVEVHHMQCVATADGRIWIASSWTGRFPRERALADILIFDTRNLTWSRRAGLAAARRRGGAAAVLVGRRIVVSHGNRGGHGPHSVSVAWADAYDVDADSWEALPDAPGARDHTGGGLVRGRVCVAGGRRGDAADWHRRPVRATHCYDPASREWAVEADMPRGRAGSAYGVSCDGVLVVAGGEGFGRAFADVHLFDGGVWRGAPKLVTARHGTGVAVHACACGLLSVAGGAGRQGGAPELRSVETLFPRGAGGLCV